MNDASQAHLALEEAPRVLLDHALMRVSTDPDELPEWVLRRLVDRARAPDKRLVVGRYLVVGELGRGGMGVVFDAWDPGIERRVAIKTIEPDLVPEEEREEVVARFRREAKVVGQLHHPAIVTIYDSGRERSKDPVSGNATPVLYYYVMEYLEGQSLARVLRERRMLPDEDAVGIAAAIADALQLSHDAGVIHRDIKPSNIFLRNNAEAVLLDFGIAKTGSIALTRQGQILGTPSYLAPERLREKEVAIDGRADIFSLGILLFTMLTGEAPFVGEDVYDVIDKIAKESHPKLARTTPAGMALSRVIDKMLAKTPDHRYQSAGEAAVALKEVLALLSGKPMEVLDRVPIREPLPEAQVTDPSQPNPIVSAPDEANTGRIAQPPTSKPDQISPVADVDTGRLDQPPKSVSMADAVSQNSKPTSANRPIAGAGSPGGMEENDPDTGRIDQPPKSTSIPDTAIPGIEGDTVDRDDSAEPAVATAVMPNPSGSVEMAREEAMEPLHGLLDEGEETDEGLPEEEAELIGEPSTEIASSDDPVAGYGSPAGEPFRTRPDLALQRDTRELLRGDRELLETADELPNIGETELDTSPSLPPYETEAALEYLSHAQENEEPTDDQALSPPALPARRAAEADISTEEVVRAGHPSHAEVQTEQVDPPRPLRPSKSTRSRRPRIEASLVDENDVVVKPAPLESLKPDELPTQTGFQVPRSSPRAEVIQSPEVDVVRARGDSKVQDPAEVSLKEHTPQVISTVPEEETPPEEEVPVSAAVARRTFAKTRQQSGRGNIQVRVSGKPLSISAEERMRTIRRNGVLLVAGVLVAIAVGLLVGKAQQKPTPVPPENTDNGQPKDPTPKVQPRVSAIGEGDEPALVRPPPADELLKEADAARSSGQLEESARLYQRAAEASRSGGKTHAQALLGKADVLKQIGQRTEAIRLYRVLIRQYPRSDEAKHAKVALTGLGVRPIPRPTKAVPPPPPKDPVKPEEPKPPPTTKVETPTGPKITSGMSVEEKCRMVSLYSAKLDHSSSAKEAIKHFEKLKAKHANAACVYWNLGTKYRQLGRHAKALSAFRTYLRVYPNSPREKRAQKLIADLEARLKQR